MRVAGPGRSISIEVDHRQGEAIVEKADVYRDRAEECRVIASQMRPGDQRSQLLDIAAQWDRMALDREALLRRFPEVAEERGRWPLSRS